MDVFLTIAATLGLTALFSFLNERFLKLQQTIGLMLIALGFVVILGITKSLGISENFDRVQDFVSTLSLDDTLLNGVLCFMLFAGSINVKAEILRAERRVILALAIGATLLGVALIGVGMWAALGVMGLSVGLIYLLIFGSLISPTDPIAALAILGKVGLPPRLETIINGESLFNDGVGVVLFSMFVAVALGTQEPSFADAIALFLREVLGGVALGLAAAAVMHFVLVRTEEYGTEVLVSLSVVALAYALAEHIEVSGPIAMVVTGLVIGNYTMPRLERRERGQFKTFWLAVDEVLNAVLFVLIGLHVAVVPMDEPLIGTATLAIVICLAGRWISVFLAVNGLSAVGALNADKGGLTNLLTWGGLRGGLAFAMALSLPDSPEKNLILHMTYGVVAFSIIIQGLTISRLFKADQLQHMLK